MSTLAWLCLTPGCNHCLPTPGPYALAWPAGELAKTTSPEEVGRATGELCQAMAKVDLGDRVIPIPPYFKVRPCHLCSCRAAWEWLGGTLQGSGGVRCIG